MNTLWNTTSIVFIVFMRYWGSATPVTSTRTTPRYWIWELDLVLGYRGSQTGQAVPALRRSRRSELQFLLIYMASIILGGCPILFMPKYAYPPAGTKMYLYVCRMLLDMVSCCVCVCVRWFVDWFCWCYHFGCVFVLAVWARPTCSQAPFPGRVPGPVRSPGFVFCFILCWIVNPGREGHHFEANELWCRSWLKSGVWQSLKS
jgi:hypothetical protein